MREVRKIHYGEKVVLFRLERRGSIAGSLHNRVEINIVQH